MSGLGFSVSHPAGAQHASNRLGELNMRELDRLKMGHAIVEMSLKPCRAAGAIVA
jgi:hypothetical protein